MLAFCCTQVGRDPRPVMRQVYDMFKDGGEPRKVLKYNSHFSGMMFFQLQHFEVVATLPYHSLCSGFLISSIIVG